MNKLNRFDMYITIKEKQNIVSLVDGTHYGEEGYPIRVAELDEIRPETNNCSEWILHLLPKTWINNDALYRLAKVINRLHPGNEINWKDTFFIVEMKTFLKNTPNDYLDADSIAPTIKRKMDIDKSLKYSTDEVHNQIDVLVDKKLRVFGLL